MRSIELYTGAGGLALGIANAGFDHVALVEYNRDACDSLRHNFPHLSHGGCTLFEGDVAAVDFTSWAGTIDVLAGGVPCQPFSIGGKHRAHADDRNLFPQTFRAIDEARPRAVLIENVRGLTRQSFREYFDYILLQLAHPDCRPSDPGRWKEHVPVLSGLADSDRSGRTTPGYQVAFRVLDAADYGVPQRRHRVFIVGLREDLGVTWEGVAPTHSEDALLYEQYVTGEYWRRHGLEPREVPERLESRVARLASEGRPALRAWRTVRDALEGLPEPRPRKETPGIPNHAGQPGARVYPGHTGSPLDLPSKALKAGVHGLPGGENMLVRDDGTPRYYTVREAARIQGFPDSYYVKGAWSEAMRQLGNAVPVQLAEAVARSVGALMSEPAPTPKRSRKKTSKAAGV